MQYLYSYSTQLLAGIQAPNAAATPINSTNATLQLQLAGFSLNN